MATKKTLSDVGNEMAQAYSNLNIWETCIAILESGAMTDRWSYAARNRVIKTVKAEQQKELTRYNKALFALADRG